MANFRITGKFLTSYIRDLWQSKEYKTAIKMGLESLEGSNISHIISIINGEMKLIGVNDLELVSDGKFNPEISFLEVLNYAMAPNAGYFRIYDQDMEVAQKIINYFLDYHLVENDNRCVDLIHQWNSLLPEVKNDIKLKIPYWMAVYLREINGDDNVKRKSKFYSVNLIESEINDNLTREKFDKLCDKFYIHSDREETWEQCIQNRKALLEPSNEIKSNNIKERFNEYETDITMKSDYGWLSPDGVFFVCNWAEHEVLASILCKYFKYSFTQDQEIGSQLSDVLLNMGYVKIHRDDMGILRFTYNRKITNQQEIKIDRYKAIHNMCR